MYKARYMKATPRIWVFNRAAYVKIRPHLISAVVIQKKKLFYVHDGCHVPHGFVWEIFRNQEVVPEDTSCLMCHNRLRYLAGTCDFQYRPRVKQVKEGVEHLLETVSTLQLQPCPILESYIRLSEFPLDNTDEYVGDWSFSQYVFGWTLWHFFTRSVPSFVRLLRFRKNR